MSPEDKDEIIRQIIIYSLGALAVVAYAVIQRQASDPDFLPTMARRLNPARLWRDSEAEAQRQVEREISWMEHGIGG